MPKPPRKLRPTAAPDRAMVSRSKDRAPEVFELRSASMTLVVVALHTTDMAAIERELTARFAGTPDMFNHDPVVIDVSQAAGDPLAIDYAQLAALLRRFNMVAAAVRGGSPKQMAAALAVGLGEAPEAVVHAPRAAAPSAPPTQQDPAARQPAPTCASPCRRGCAASTSRSRSCSRCSTTQRPAERPSGVGHPSSGSLGHHVEAHLQEEGLRASEEGQPRPQAEHGPQLLTI